MSFLRKPELMYMSMWCITQVWDFTGLILAPRSLMISKTDASKLQLSISQLTMMHISYEQPMSTGNLKRDVNRHLSIAEVLLFYKLQNLNVNRS